MTEALNARIVAALSGMEQDTASVSELNRRLPDVPRRTLQRRLRTLTETGHITAVGGGRSRRYSAHVQSGSTEAPQGAAVWLSAGGAQVRAAVIAPLSHRQPCGYQRQFLDDYRPNETFYLSSEQRARLHGFGCAPIQTGPAGTYARQILERLLIDLSWASSRLEGNTYSRLDTENLIRFGHQVSGKDQLEAQMILNHKSAIELLVDGAETIGFDSYTVCNLHAVLADGLLPDPGAGGRLRSIQVGIGASVYQPTAIPHLIQECFEQILAKATRIVDPFERSLFALVHLPYLQPFDDVNKGVSRLAANIPFILDNLAPLSFVDVQHDDYVHAILGVGELRRVDLMRDLFVWAYERSCQRYTLTRQALPQPDPVRLRYRNELKELVHAVVVDNRRVGESALRAHAAERVPEDDSNAVVALAMNELFHLHAGNFARFGISPSQFTAWTNRPLPVR
jgi:DNA-binding transcriptional ArsR family regulator